MTNFYHTPIMLNEIIDYLNIKSGGVYVDCTVGGGGHTLEILKKLKNSGKVIVIDKDNEAISYCKEKFKQYSNVIYINNDFKNIESILNNIGIYEIDGCLMDLGVSSHQIDTPKRGFSFRLEGPLDMRMNQDQNFTAYDVINSYSYKQLLKLLYTFGEEKFSKQIVKNIILNREIKPIETTKELNDIIEKSLPAKIVYKSGGAAKKTFQAIRIEVNNELNDLDCVLDVIIKKLKKGGRLCVLSFHSLEDRIVKNIFRLNATECICASNIPICVCGHKASVKILTKKPLIASVEEQKSNSRSTSAKLRVVEKI